MLLKLCQAGHPTLRTHAKPVARKDIGSERIQMLIDAMIATLRDAPGVGLAAPQVGEALRIIIMEDKAAYHEVFPAAVLKAQGRKPVPLKVVINPVLTVLDDSPQLWFEGCLSVDGYVAAVPRALSVKVTGLDRHGKPVALTASGWQARILQHEVGHLDGELFIDHMRTTSFMTLKHFGLSWRKALQATIRKDFPD